jgi:hypothetical protein
MTNLYMESEAKREESFSHSTWPHNGTHLTPVRLAAAGFYAAPTARAPDRVVCFACENALTNWDVTDDPWVEHKTWYPQCPFVQGKQTGNIPKRRNIVPKAPTPPSNVESKTFDHVAIPNESGRKPDIGNNSIRSESDKSKNKRSTSADSTMGGSGICCSSEKLNQNMLTIHACGTWLHHLSGCAAAY